MAETSSDTYEYATERYSTPREAAKYWSAEINNASKREDRWREDANFAAERYDSGQSKENDIRDAEGAFNILHSNIETMVPALYNSTPVPDARPRNNRQDELARLAGTTLEESIAFQVDSQDFDKKIIDAIYDREIAGRGFVRVRYNPIMTGTDNQTGEEVAFEETTVECVPWNKLRVGSADDWDYVPWIAFKHSMTRDELIELIADDEYDEEGIALAESVPLDEMDDDKSDSEVKGVFKRACVWEIWDKDSRNVIYFAEGYEESLLTVMEDPLQLRNFWPGPRPLQAYRRGKDRISPLCPYNTYKAQAEELERISTRILKLTEALKWRGVRAAEIAELEQVATAEDGEFLPSQNAMDILNNNGDLNKAVWSMPIVDIANVLKELYQQRELCKQTIYEITGLSDVMRGATNAHETARAQSIKSEWGTQRLSKQQRDVQRFVRDTFEIMAEIMSNFFQQDSFAMMTGAAVPDPIMELLRSDVNRHYRVDIETDSTIAGDVGRIQQNMNGFIQATSQFMQQALPGVQQGIIPPDAAAELFAAMASTFQLGRRVEDVLAQVAEQAKNMPDPSQPTPEQQEAQQIAKQKEISEIEENKANTQKLLAEAEKAKAEVGVAAAKAQQTQVQTMIDPIEKVEQIELSKDARRREQSAAANEA